MVLILDFYLVVSKFGSFHKNIADFFVFIFDIYCQVLNSISPVFF